MLDHDTIEGAQDTNQLAVLSRDLVGGMIYRDLRRRRESLDLDKLCPLASRNLSWAFVSVEALPMMNAEWLISAELKQADGLNLL